MNLIGINGYAGTGKDTVAWILRAVDTIQSRKSSSIPAGDIVELHNKGWFPLASELSEWKVRKFAEPLKEMAAIMLGVSRDLFESEEFKGSNLGPEWDTFSIIEEGEDSGGKYRLTLFNSAYEEAAQKVVAAYNEAKSRSSCPKTTSNPTIHIERVPMTVRTFLQRLGTDAIRNELHQKAWCNAAFADYKEGDKWIFTDTRFPDEADEIRSRGGIVIRVNRPGITPSNNHKSDTALDDYNFDHIIYNDGSPVDLINKIIALDLIKRS